MTFIFCYNWIFSSTAVQNHVPSFLELETQIILKLSLGNQSVERGTTVLYSFITYLPVH